MKLDFIIIGGQKCGSTYLHHIINEHPDISMVSGESPEFETPDYENGGLEKLKNKIQKLDQNKVIGIKRPNYLCSEEVPERLFKESPNAKLIVILRNPVERLKSSYFHQINNGFCPVLEINTGVKKLLDGSLNESYPRTKNIIKYGFYSTYLKKYINLFEHNLLILTYDELRENRDQVIKKCYKFLNVDESFVPQKEINKRPQKVTYSIPRVKFLVKANKYRFSYNKNKTRLFEKKQNLWDILNYSIIKGVDKYILNYFFKNEKPELSEKNKLKLIEIYKDDIQALESMINCDLNSWKK